MGLHWSQQTLGIVVSAIFDARKPVFGVSNKVRLKPVCSATETCLKNEISLVASLAMILSNKRITKSLIRLRGCAGWTAPLLFENHRRQFFSRRDPFYFLTLILLFLSSKSLSPCYCKFGNFRENFIFAKSDKIHMRGVENS